MNGLKLVKKDDMEVSKTHWQETSICPNCQKSNMRFIRTDITNHEVHYCPKCDFHLTVGVND